MTLTSKNSLCTKFGDVGDTRLARNLSVVLSLLFIACMSFALLNKSVVYLFPVLHNAVLLSPTGVNLLTAH